MTRDLTTRGTSDWAVEQVAASFKGAKKTDVEDVLDSLTRGGASYKCLRGARGGEARNQSWPLGPHYATCPKGRAVGGAGSRCSLLLSTGVDIGDARDPDRACRATPE